MAMSSSTKPALNYFSKFMSLKQASTTGKMLTTIETFAEPHFEVAERSCSRNYILILKELNLKESGNCLFVKCELLR